MTMTTKQYEDALANLKDTEEYTKHCTAPYEVSVNDIPAIKSALQAQVDGGWLPIESAPKDGSSILGCSVGKQPVNCHWFEQWGKFVFSIQFGAPARGGCHFVTHPTHWQPLPQPPKETV